MVGALVMVTVLYIVYQFAFVAELGAASSNRPPEARGRHAAPSLDTSNKKHPRDVNVRDAREMVAGNKGDEGKERKQGVGGEKRLVNDTQQSVKQQKGINPIMTLTFKCATSGRQISVDKINDNYCDCPADGSDEPRTNACANGNFICLKWIKPFPESIPSGWVNDGVCDCCDGSDEWKMIKSVTNLAVSLQNKIGRYVSPCPDQCPHTI